MSEVFCERLKRFRKESGLTQLQFSEKIGVHLQTVSKWERGVSEPDFALLGLIAQTLNVSLERLIGTEESETVYTGEFDPVRFGKALASLRRIRGEGQNTVADLTNSSADIVSKWERGIICPNAEQLIAIAKWADISVSALYFGIDKEEKTETPIQARKRRKISFALLGASLMICISVVLIILFIPKQAQEAKEIKEIFTVRIGDKTYDIEEDGWFMPQISPPEGYELEGFYDERGNKVNFPLQIDGDRTFTAVFSPKEYKIDYYLNGGYFESDVPFTFTKESGQIQLTSPKKSGAEFEGWYLTPDYTGEAVSSVSWSGKDVTLYAKWDKTVYTVRYDLAGGTISYTNPEQVTNEQEIVLFEPIRKGYNFLGWFDESGVKRESVGGKNAKNLSLTARWQQSGEKWKVTYECNGGKVQGNPETVGAGEFHKLNSAEKYGYVFIGWNESSDGKGEFYDCLYGLQSELTLYAIYEPRVSTVVYELNGGGWGEEKNPNSIMFGEEVVLVPVYKYGHKFLGWYDENSGKYVDTINEDNIFEISRLSAKFERLTFTVSLDAGEGFIEHEGANVHKCILNGIFGEELLLPSAVLAGQIFSGWDDGSGSLTDRVSDRNIENLTFVAEYALSSDAYTITYELSGGVNSEQNPVQVLPGQKIPLFAAEKVGYDFLGWCDRADGGGNYFTNTDPEWSENIVLYAIWQERFINGTKGNFSYSKGARSVTITGYKGTVTEDKDIVYPSYIDGLPVVAIEEDQFGKSHASIRSIVLPENIQRLGKAAFDECTIEQPLVIPASVEEIEEQCFIGCTLNIAFEVGSRLKVIRKETFYNCYFKNSVVLPEGIERLETLAFQEVFFWNGGMVLPETLKEIEPMALRLISYSVGCSNRKTVLPESVEYVGSDAFGGGEIYLTGGYEQTLNFESDWSKGCSVYYIEKVTGVTLRDDGEEINLSGQSFALPKPSKEGKIFLGWKNGDNFVNQWFIPQANGVVLDAAYTDDTDTDGYTLDSVAVLADGESRTFVIPAGGEIFYVPPQESKRVRFHKEQTVQGCSCQHGTDIGRYNGTIYPDYLSWDSSIDFEKSDVFTSKPAYNHSAIVIITITLTVLE